MSTEEEEVMKDPDIPYEHAVFGLEQFKSSAQKFFDTVDPQKWTKYNALEVTVKEGKLSKMETQLEFWREKIILACSVVKDSHQVLQSHQVTLDLCENLLEKAQLQILLARELCNHKKKSTTNSNQDSEELPDGSDFKLERTKPPTFSGNYSEWPHFADLFKAAVIDNKKISGASKLIYLKNSLTGEAASIAASFPPTNLSFTEAWALVEKRYNKKREIAFSHLQKLFSLQTVPDTTSGLRKVIDLVNQTSISLKQMGLAVDQWDVFIVYWVQTKLDAETRKQWLLSEDDNLPVLSEFLEFLERRSSALSEPTKYTKVKPTTSSTHHVNATHNVNATQNKQPLPTKCPKCSAEHRLFHCPEFQGLSLHDKWSFVHKCKLCNLCLRHGHSTADCFYKTFCRHCNQKHHPTLHKFDSKDTTSSKPDSHQSQGHSNSKSKESQSTPSTSATKSNPPNDVTALHSTAPFSNDSVVLMATLIVNVCDANGNLQPCRVFLDPGSDTNFVSENFMSRLGLTRQHSCVNITGIGGSKSDFSRGLVSFVAHSTSTNFSLPVKALVLPKLTGHLPREKCQINFPHLEGLTLSDPIFHSPAHVDILFGAEVEALIKLPGLRRGLPGTPIAQNTKFGWYLSGSAPTQVSVSNFFASSFHSTCSVSDQCLESSLQKFWELEEPTPTSSNLTSADQQCEDHFLSTFTRDPQGRYEVNLPFSTNAGVLGESRQKAVSCFRSLERQLEKDPALQENYHSQIENFISNKWVDVVPPLKSTEKVKVRNVAKAECTLTPYYIPHHVVVKPENTTTKVRIVFNASAKTTSGESLNSLLLPGPKIQTDLHPLLTRFRSHQIALSADIVKFYHQVKVHPDHSDFQRFVWRKSPDHTFTDLRFNRVIFGVTSAPFLAIRVLRQLGEDAKAEFPLAHAAITSDFLVDNLLSGAATVEEAMQLKSQVTTVLHQGKFPLQKWCSNHPEVLSTIPTSERETFSLNIQEDESVKTIGLYWHPNSDTFGVKIIDPPKVTQATKREVLSHTARVFDPLNWLAPVTIIPKIILQELWKLKLTWDEPIPLHIFKKWEKYCSELSLLKQFRVPRCLTFSTFSPDNTHYDIIGFCDASTQAYCACAYLRSIQNGEVKVELIAAKTRVAPVAGETTPKLELCSAVLLTNLVNSIATALSPTKIKLQKFICFTDSTGALGQLFSAEKQSVFVLNRVRKIKNSTAQLHWFHVPGGQNPADLPTRGLTSHQLLTSELWLHGPTFLLTDELPPQPYTISVTSLATTTSTGIDYVNSCLLRLITTVSSFQKMKRLIAYWLRYKTQLRQRCVDRVKTKLTSQLATPIQIYITPKEIKDAVIPLVKCIQILAFSPEINFCAQCNKKPPTTKIRFLSPFLDENGVLRVGGRLQQSPINFHMRHPILLPKFRRRPSNTEQQQINAFVLAIVRDFHQHHLHAGPKLLLSLVRTEFWIQRGHDLCKWVYRRCIQCFRVNPQPSLQLMGQLPPARVTNDFPFVKVGVDYAGPFEIAATTGRKPRMLKAYVCVFVCMATKAIHLEFSGGLSTPDFLSAFHRFISIRNAPSDIFCDGGRNFLGAKNEMEELQRLISSPQHLNKVNLFCLGESINFHFSPPYGPHHGGIWEAAVKSMKTNLAKVTQGHHPSIEEFVTLLARTSANLNSRPLTPLSDSPDDFQVLTPFHFLTLRGPREVTEEDVTWRKSHHSRWQHVQQMTQHLFKRWKLDYLHTLQQKGKWLDSKPNISKDMLVLLHDADSSIGPQRWTLGRIEAVFPGKDGLVRSCDVRIPVPPDPAKPDGKPYKIFHRPITKLSPLPLDDNVIANYSTLQ